MRILNAIFILINALLAMLFAFNGEYSKACYFLLVAVFMMEADKYGRSSNCKRNI